MKLIETILAALLLSTLMITLPACEEQGPFEEAGENIEDAADDTGDAIQDATEDAGDAIEDATDGR